MITLLLPFLALGASAKPHWPRIFTTIKDKFSIRMWLSITQACTETELLREAIHHAEGRDCHDDGKSRLESTLADTIRDKKTFVVLDDMWTAAKWNDVLKASFSYVARGSRVLVTTRDDRVARSMKAQYLHHVDYLGPQDAWTLLKKEVIATERDQLEIDTLKDIGSNILGRCGGLPLAIKVIGGLLRQRSINIVEWERVLDNPAWSIDGMPEELNHALYLSYDDLPPHLKQCLIYYSLIPQKTNISPDQLIEMWISEGLVSSRYSDDLEQIGRDYNEELIMRNLIQPYKECIGHSHYVMHDVVRSFCQYMVRDEALEARMGEGGIGSSLLSHKFRFLSIGVESGSDELEWSVLQNQSSLRTLISCCPIRFKHNDSLSRLSRLRTMHLENADFIPLLADHLGELKLLRYLTIESTQISSLPDTIGQLKFLQHIGLSGCEKMVRLPNGIVKLKQLRSVYLGEAVNIIPKKFGELTNLRKILNFPANMDGGANGWCTLEELGPLSQLRDLSLKGLENVHPSSLAAKAMLRSKKHLGRLALKCSSIIEDDGGSVKRVVTEEEERHIEEVFAELCPPGCINHLTIDGYFGRRLPEWVMSMTGVSLERLRILELSNLALCTQLPNGLCQLPCLEILIVLHAPAIKHVGPEFMRHTHKHNNKRHSRVSVSFPSLKKLIFIEMVRWEEWEWEWECEELLEAMPVLLELTLKCRSLTQLPPGLSFYARALKMLNLQDVHCLYYLENLPCVVELSLECCHSVKRITNLPSLQKLAISCCSRLSVLEAVPALRYLNLQSSGMRRLPRYLRGLNLTRLYLCCDLPLLCSMALGKSTYDWNKFCHIRRVEAHTHNGPNGIFTVTYTRDPCYLETNISSALFNLLGRRWLCTLCK
ncbi:putative disease resistance RPP13-like protein 1 [Miscanthus floridulus]|uniref:putative disease resistance RPP13-like protein 1 n=1 Tax=Miscanthus floridulus TaxID=154761 RepID=UPI003458B24F